MPQHARPHKPCGEANGGARCGKSARCVRRGGGWNRGTAEILGHSQTKGRANRGKKLRPKPARQSSTLPMSGVWKRSHGRTSEAPPDERGGNRYVRPTATAPNSDSTTGGKTLTEYMFSGLPQIADILGSAASGPPGTARDVIRAPAEIH